MRKSRILKLMTVFVILAAACGPLDILYKEIRRYGYINYPSPLEFAGPGTMVGGSPSRLSLVASPTTCFPDEINGEPTNLRRIDSTSIPQRSYRFQVSGKFKLGVIDFLQMGNPVIGVGAEFNKVKSMDISMEGVHIEYLDAIRLTEYYPKMPELCKRYLEYVGFVIQAIKVDRLLFKFRDVSGGAIKIDLENLDQIVDIGVDVKYTIDDQVTLNITTPKYIGYQLGKLQIKDEGMALYRASRINWRGKFVFRSINIFNPFVAGATNLEEEESGLEHLLQEEDFRPLTAEDYLDQYSEFVGQQ
ncbi:MAG: hypothetical protein HQK52_05075 [Oligoflexia bacterium]|nr:hypothetical protein [Oligoflexia bacterium]